MRPHVDGPSDGGSFGPLTRALLPHTSSEPMFAHPPPRPRPRPRAASLGALPHREGGEEGRVGRPPTRTNRRAGAPSPM